MNNPARHLKLGDIADQYDALLCDAWGVIHNGVELLPGAGDALRQFRQERGPVAVLTNAPRPASIIPGQLDRLGLPRAAYDTVVTSGDATRQEIRRRLPKPAYRIGPQKDDPLFVGLDINFVSLEDAAFVICTGMIDDQSENPEDYRATLKTAAARGLEMICANPDILVNWGGRMIWCAGALAQIYEELGGVVIYGGKPHAPIYQLAFEAIANLWNEQTKPRILAVGDGLKTDILGANQAGIDAMLITGRGGLIAEGADISAQLSDAGVEIVAAAERLEW